MGGYDNSALVTEMMNNFQSRSGYDAWQVEIRPGKTESYAYKLWQEIVELLDGRVIGFGCDFDIESSYVGNCRI